MESLRGRPGPDVQLGERSGPGLLAAAITGAMLVTALIAGTAAPRAWWSPGEPPAEERITYVAPPVPVRRPAPPTANVARPAPSRAPTAPATPVVPTSPAAARPFPSLPVDTGGAARGPRGAPVAPTTPGTRPVPGAAAGVRGPTLSPMPLRVGAELPQSAPLTRSEKDSVLRAYRSDLMGSAAVAAAIAEGRDTRARATDQAQREETRSMGGYSPARLKLGVTVVGFGGPSADQRKRDAAVDAEVKTRLAASTERAVRQRADSARRDSVRLANDAIRTAVPLRRDSL